MKNIKYAYEMLNVYWNLKPLIKSLFIILIAFIVFSIITQTATTLFLFGFALLGMLILFVVSWFKDVKPMIKEVEKEIKLEDKYKFFLKRFNN